MRAPRSLMAAIGDDAIKAAAASSPLQSKYGQTVDSRSAFEVLAEKAAQAQQDAPVGQAPAKKNGKPAPEKLQLVAPAAQQQELSELSQRAGQAAHPQYG